MQAIYALFVSSFKDNTHLYLNHIEVLLHDMIQKLTQ